MAIVWISVSTLIILAVAASIYYYLYIMEKPPITLGGFRSTTYQQLLELGHLDPLPKGYYSFMDRNLVTADKRIIVVPCLHDGCQPNTFYLFVKLDIPKLSDLLFFGGTYLVEYTINKSETKQISGDLENLLYNNLVKIGPVNGGSSIEIKGSYTAGDETKVSDSAIVNLPNMTPQYCTTIPYGNQRTVFFNNGCYAPTDELNMYRCLTGYDPTTGNVRMWNQEEGRCVSLVGKENPTLRDKCRKETSGLDLNEYCDEQEVVFEEPIYYECQLPKTGNVPYDKDMFERAFNNKIAGQSAADHWKLEYLDDIWDGLYDCTERYSGKNVNSLPCLEFVDENKKAMCNKYQEAKTGTPNCGRWVKEGNNAKCVECKPGFYGSNCQFGEDKIPTDNQNCAKWNVSGDTFTCDQCKSGYYGDKCEHSLQEMMDKNPNCAQWDFSNGKFNCRKCQTGFYDNNNNCKDNIRDVEKEYPGCSDWYYDGIKFVCVSCKRDYHISDDNCKYSLEEAQNAYPGCGEWEFNKESKEFICKRCLSNNFAGDKCEINLKEEHPGCANWKRTNGDVECVGCNVDHYLTEENCKYTPDKEKYPDCLQWEFNEEDRSFSCKECGNYYEGRYCETDLEEKYPGCKTFEKGEDGKFTCKVCEPGYDGEDCTNYLMGDYPNCENNSWRMVGDNLVCNKCKQGYKGDKCKKCRCNAPPSTLDCIKDGCPNCKFIHSDITDEGNLKLAKEKCGTGIYDPVSGTLWDWNNYFCQRFLRGECKETTSTEPGCNKWEEVDGGYNCVECKEGYFGDGCEYSFDEFKAANPGCADQEFTEFGFECTKCKPEYYGSECQGSLAEDKKKFPGCAEWEIYTDEDGILRKKCNKCGFGYVNTNNYCNFYQIGAFRNCETDWREEGKENYVCNKCKLGWAGQYCNECIGNECRSCLCTQFYQKPECATSCSNCKLEQSGWSIGRQEFTDLLNKCTASKLSTDSIWNTPDCQKLLENSYCKSRY